MSKFIDTLKSIDPTILVALVLMFAVGFIVGQQTAGKDVKKHYIVDASEVEIVYHNPYKALTLDESPSDCKTGDKECEQANKLNAGKPAHYPAICEPYIFSKD